MIDQKFNRYEIREELGMGGMATVYRAYDPMFEREVALKVLKRELLEDKQLRGRFERETKIIAKLEHTAIVPVYDVGHDNKQLFYVMRYMAGGSLSERIQNGLTAAEIAHVTLRVAAALDYAHGKGIVHRDLKPGNILFDEHNNPFISDFGIAKVAQAATRITNSGIIGTPRYMSPEQARGEEADGRSDLYALGVIMFEMLSGETPFEATTPLAMAFKHATEEPPSVLKVNPNLPAGIEAVLQKALAKKQDDRYNTCGEFAKAFFEIFPDAASPEANLITPPPPRARHIAESATELPLKPAYAPKARPVWMTGVTVALVLLALTFSVYQFMTPLNASTPTPTPAAPTQTLSAPTTAPTHTPAPTETLTPTTIPVDPGVGGADKIALTANNEIYLMNMDGTGIQPLTRTKIPKFDLQWLPGGRELLYGEGKCVYKIDISKPDPKPETIVCFTDSNFEGVRVSPEGKYVAIAIAHRLIVYPFDLQKLSTVKTAFELQSSAEICLDYANVTVKSAQWSADGRNLAILYQGAVGQQLLGDTIRVMQVDQALCKQLDPLILDEIPGKQFVPDGYKAHPILPAYNWDGDRRFLFNTFIRNLVYGHLYLYDMSTGLARKINPVNGICCYSDAIFSPDGTYILLVFQDESLGSDSQTRIYYIPVDQIGTDAVFTPMRLHASFFPNPREDIQIALRPSAP